MLSSEINLETINTVIIEDDEFSKFGISSAIQTDGENNQKIKVVGETRFGIEGLKIIDQILPDIVICDIGLPDISGIEVILRIKEKFKDKIRILVVSGNVNKEVVGAAIKNGANSFFTKTTNVKKLVEAVCATAKGESWLDSNISKILIDGFNNNSNSFIHDLTQRELTILQLMAEGMQNEEIANKLCISEGTIRSHTHKIYSKLQVTNRIQAVIKGVKLGIVTIESKNSNHDSTLKMKNFINQSVC